MRRAEIVDLLDEQALRGQHVVAITDYAWERADGQLVWQGETLIYTGDGTLDARRFDDQIANRHQVLATRWARTTHDTPRKHGRRHRVAARARNPHR